MDSLHLCTLIGYFNLFFYRIYLLLSVQKNELVIAEINSLRLTASIFPDFSVHTILRELAIVLGWGLGHQSHTVTKLMGIKKVKDMKKVIALAPWQRLAQKATLIFTLYYFKILITYKLVLFTWSGIGSSLAALFHISSITNNKRITI